MISYDFGNKRQYRRTFWNFVDQNSEIPIKRRRAMFLESKEALETIFLAKQKHYRPDNLFPVTKNPAEAAWISRRAKQENLDIRSRGVDIVQAIRELTEPIHVLNLDFTGIVSQALLEIITEILKAPMLLSRSVVGITILRGRDPGFDDSKRFNSILKCVLEAGQFTLAQRVGVYNSVSGQSMMCFMFKLIHWSVLNQWESESDVVESECSRISDSLDLALSLDAAEKYLNEYKRMVKCFPPTIKIEKLQDKFVPSYHLGRCVH